MANENKIHLAGTLPAFPQFDHHNESWKSYKNRMFYYFDAHEIKKKKKKLSLFLSSVNSHVFNLLENLLSPADITDATTTFNKVEQALDSHFDESANILSSSFEFYSCHQKPEQPLAEWLAELREKGRHCGFTTSKLNAKPLDRALQDMLVLGTNDPKVRQKLLEEGDPTLEEAEKIAKAAEQLRTNISKFNSQSTTIAKVRPSQSKGKSLPLFNRNRNFPVKIITNCPNKMYIARNVEKIIIQLMNVFIKI